MAANDRNSLIDRYLYAVSSYLPAQRHFFRRRRMRLSPFVFRSTARRRRSMITGRATRNRFA